MNDCPAAAGQRAVARRALRADRRRLHDGLRHHPADQLRPRRDLHDRGLRRAADLLSCPSGTSPSGCCRSCWSAAIDRLGRRSAVLIERFAYRPLRNAPRLAPLITAIGVSIFLQEAVRLLWLSPAARSQASDPVPADRRRHRSGDPARRAHHPARRRSSRSSPLAICMVALCVFVNRTRPAAPCRPPRRTPTPPG